MKILCLVKLVPDVDQLRYDREKNILVRDHAQLMLNPDDATAVATALGFKKEHPDTSIEVVSMAPSGAIPHLEDLVRRGIDIATLISDPSYAGSDTWVTSTILARFLKGRAFDCVFCGTQTLDGGTGQVPAQLAEALSISHMAGIGGLVGLSKEEGAIVDVEGETALSRYSVPLPAVLGFYYSPKRKLPYIRYEDLNRDVSGQISVLGNGELGFDSSEVGLTGSLTQVRRLETDALEAKDPLILNADEQGISFVYAILKQKGFLRT